MGKLTRQQKKEEERRIIAEMEAALQENTAEESETTGKDAVQEENLDEKGDFDKKKRGFYDEETPETVHCKRCKTLMENGKCPVCGFYIYTPMDKKKRDKIRLVVATVCMVAFVILFVLLQFKNN